MYEKNNQRTAQTNKKAKTESNKERKKAAKKL